MELRGWVVALVGSGLLGLMIEGVVGILGILERGGWQRHSES